MLLEILASGAVLESDETKRCVGRVREKRRSGIRCRSDLNSERERPLFLACENLGSSFVRIRAHKFAGVISYESFTRICSYRLLRCNIRFPLQTLLSKSLASSLVCGKNMECLDTLFPAGWLFQAHKGAKGGVELVVARSLHSTPTIECRISGRQCSTVVYLPE